MSYDASTGRFGVTRYPDGYAVIDKADGNKIVFSTSNKAAAHAKAAKLAAASRAEAAVTL